MATRDKLTDKAIKAALKQAASLGKVVKAGDGDGLWMLAQPSGAGWWRQNYTLAGKEKGLSVGVYPDITLAIARTRRDEIRRQVATGVDPSAERQRAKQATAEQIENQRLAEDGLPLRGTFENVARRWHSVREPDWSKQYAKKIIQRLENKVFPFVGKRQMREISPPEWLEVIRRCEADGLVDTAHSVRDSASAVYRFAIAEGVAVSDPLRDLSAALKRHTVKHYASIIEPNQFKQLLRSIAAYRGMPSVKAALQLLTLVFLRPGAELRMAQWSEFDLDGETWRVPSARLKREKDGKLNGPDHLVPLSKQAVALMRDLKQFTGDCDYVFRGRSSKSKPISENTINAALTALGFDGDTHRAHGFRASARTMLHERLKYDPAVIEHQLAHSVPDANGTAYNRTQFIEDRRQMMQAWADYVDQLRDGDGASLKLVA